MSKPDEPVEIKAKAGEIEGLVWPTSRCPSARPDQIAAAAWGARLIAERDEAREVAARCANWREVATAWGWAIPG